MVPAFKPSKEKAKSTKRHIGYSCSEDRYLLLTVIAEETGISLKELLRQMVDFALEHRWTQ